MCFCPRGPLRPRLGCGLFVRGDLGSSLLATTDESGYFALPLKALRRTAPLPARLRLGQNFPNPFNPSTIIPYQLPAATRVRLEVFNILGQRVATLVDGERPAGFHTATWNGTDASGRGVGSGVYLYRLLGGRGAPDAVDGAAGRPGGRGGWNRFRRAGNQGGSLGPDRWHGGASWGQRGGWWTLGEPGCREADRRDRSRGGVSIHDGRNRLCGSVGTGLRGGRRSVRQVRRSRRYRSGEMGSGPRQGPGLRADGLGSGADPLRRPGLPGRGRARRDPGSTAVIPSSRKGGLPGACWETSTGTGRSISPTPCWSPRTARTRPCPLPTATSPWGTSTRTGRSTWPTPG